MEDSGGRAIARYHAASSRPEQHWRDDILASSHRRRYQYGNMLLSMNLPLWQSADALAHDQTPTATVVSRTAPTDRSYPDLEA